MRIIAPLALLLFVGTSKSWAQNTDDMMEITSLSSLGTTGNYVITQDIDAADFNASIGTFSGTLEARINPSTNMPFRIKGLTVPLFGTLTGTVKNVVLEDVEISQDGQVGAVACVANNSSRIYNVGILGGNVGSTGTATGDNSADCCGGIVGLLDGEARVVNCYSYANITSGNRVGGIVGYNNVSTTRNNLKTMVMNCMFYGNITGSVNISPIYNGNNITNDNGVGNFNYFWGEAPYMQDAEVAANYTYNCALMAETRFLQRFEFFRHLLNGHRELAAWWATDNRANKADMMKWVLLPDSIGTDHPYPILKTPGYYPSVVNYAPSNEDIDPQNAHRNEGRKLGTLTVNIQMGSGAVFGAPTGAAITTSSLTLNITDKDTAHFNFNYYKVQLPYYNDLGTCNYRKASDGTNRVVTGWKIVSITTDGSVASYNSFTTGDDAEADATGAITIAPYNFADRNCTDKDLYSTSGRVFNQGAYWDVPEGVTAITIEPYWAKATYLADSCADVVYNKAMNSIRPVVSTVGGGKIFINGNNYDIDGEDKTVYTSVENARDALSPNGNYTVYDYAIVLVGNVHRIGVSSGSKVQPYTIMSADFDHDNEPDYSYILRFNDRCETHPVRLDFINIPGSGMAQKSYGANGTYNLGIFQPNGWFESTNTSLFRVTQFEYDRRDRAPAPLILQGGVIEQWVSSKNNDGVSNRTTYFHVGGNVWFKEFQRGTHQDKQFTSKHPPISVTGGDYDEFYLTGLYRGDVDNYNDNAECYINGGCFGLLAGAGQEGIGNATTHTNGNIIWQIQNADIDEFYGGGFNATRPIMGNITTVITGSYVKQFYGGPKFGDMNVGKTVKTTATNCTFDNFYGAGYGGNSYSRRAPLNQNKVYNIDWNEWVNGNENGWLIVDEEVSAGYSQIYDADYGGVETQITYQFLPYSNNESNVARLLVEYVSFSLATTRDVTSTLTGCTIIDNFYGGGRLGKVDGNVTSTLTNCTVQGNAFGAGYSASLPTVEVMDLGGFQTQPYYNENLGVYMPAVFPATQTYQWEHAEAVNSTATAIDTTQHILYTTEHLTTLGTVTGTATLTIKGDSFIGIKGQLGTDKHGNVFGGGDESEVNGNTSVRLLGNTEVLNNVYGGGNLGKVNGNTDVTIDI